MMSREEMKVGAAALLLIGATALLIHFAKPRGGNPGLAFESATLTNELGQVVRNQRVRFPERLPGFNSMDAPITKSEVENLPIDTEYGRKLYWDDTGFGAQMSAVMMKSDRTSIHRPQVCVTGQGFRIDKTEVIEIPVALPTPYTLQATCLTLSKQERDPSTGQLHDWRAMYIYWFVAEHRMVPDHPEALWFVSQDLLTTGVLHPWAYVSCFSRCAPGQEAVMLARMKRLIALTAPESHLIGRAPPQQTASLATTAPLN